MLFFCYRNGTLDVRHPFVVRKLHTRYVRVNDRQRRMTFSSLFPVYRLHIVAQTLKTSHTVLVAATMNCCFSHFFIIIFIYLFACLLLLIYILLVTSYFSHS
uniref:Uncharacterized protein n=1 Tax=Trypanosoma vivax (strain Y486) TaxID=1055687 RepID=G0TWN9_TRYVY|nr:hypothetical protein TVY486_0601680 [Trypanosoma vivax Y486]